MKLLRTQQALATDHFITEYGPRTAVIQQRLRPVYGFGEVEVSSKDSAIGIRVHRKGETLRPMDFFSQSQVQTLVLGLFLTACSSQTPSGFSSIMMDDPVTHFDDRNTYALLDLILRWQSSPEGEWQFVISTCDEKLLQLARYKFRHMGGREVLPLPSHWCRRPNGVRIFRIAASTQKLTCLGRSAGELSKSSARSCDLQSMIAQRSLARPRCALPFSPSEERYPCASARRWPICVGR